MNLYIIFGTSKGLGEALYNYIDIQEECDFIVLNNSDIAKIKNNIRNLKINLAVPLTEENCSAIWGSVEFDKYKKVYLVNNASVIDPIKLFGEMRKEDVEDSVYINYLNYLIIINSFIQRVSKLFRAEFRVVNITSGAADSPHEGLSIYCSTKLALEMVTRCIFLEQERLKNVKIIAIRPGIINTSMQKTMRESSEEDFFKVGVYKELYNSGGLSSPYEIAKKIYTIFHSDKYWLRPIVDVSEVN